MSYILDALKKNEAERDPEARTSLSLEQSARQRHHMLQTLILSALLINAVVLVWLFYPEGNQLQEEASSPGASQAPGEPVRAAPRQAVTQEITSLSTQSESSRATAAPTAADSTAASTAAGFESPTPVRQPPAARPAALITLDELPLAARNRFPDLDFSSHIYAEDPTMRAIVVNGTQLSAGSSYGSVVLKEITEEGVVFLFEKYLVSINVLESWQ